MTDYQHILLAVDFGSNIEQVLARTTDLVERYQAHLTLLHVVENMPISDAGYGPIIPFEFDLTEQLTAAARQRMEQLGQTPGLENAQTRIESGSPKVEIIRVAEEIGADLIIVGSHGRHGLALLLGSTASGVIHHAKCDVLAVRLSS